MNHEDGGVHLEGRTVNGNFALHQLANASENIDTLQRDSPAPYQVFLE